MEMALRQAQWDLVQMQLFLLVQSVEGKCSEWNLDLINFERIDGTYWILFCN